MHPFHISWSYSCHGFKGALTNNLVLFYIVQHLIVANCLNVFLLYFYFMFYVCIFMLPCCKNDFPMWDNEI